MLVNQDFSKPAVVTPADYHWVASPQPGVERVMLDRLGGEKARATSIVRYAAQSNFPPHGHPGGEEILVLSGTFSEGDRHYPAGYYLRNPPGSSHQPSSQEGAVIFVKLWQMTAEEAAPVAINTRDPGCWVQQQGREVCPLFHGWGEQVCLLRLAPGQALDIACDGGAEWLVISGAIITADGVFGSGSWMRMPAGVGSAGIQAGSEGATLYLKTGHLAELSPSSRPHTL